MNELCISNEHGMWGSFLPLANLKINAMKLQGYGTAIVLRGKAIQGIVLSTENMFCLHISWIHIKICII